MNIALATSTNSILAAGIRAQSVSKSRESLIYISYTCVYVLTNSLPVGVGQHVLLIVLLVEAVCHFCVVKRVANITSSKCISLPISKYVEPTLAKPDLA